MFCGTRSFSQNDSGKTPATWPKGSKLKQKKQPRHSKNNPYSSAGMDKFERILAELDARKERIMSRARSQGDATVRFTYRPDSEDWIPIIIKKRELREEKAKAASKRLSAPPSMKAEKRELEEIKKDGKEDVRKCKEVREVRRRRRYSWWNCYWPLVIVLVLVLLVFGRSFAICWTTICWYLVPIMKSGEKSLRRRELGKRLSDKRLGGGVHDLGSPKGHNIIEKR